MYTAHGFDKLVAKFTAVMLSQVTCYATDYLSSPFQAVGSRKSYYWAASDLVLGAVALYI